MTKNALQAILNEYEDKVKQIHGTGFSIFLNHAKNKETLSNSDIELKTFGGEDFICYKEYDFTAAKDREVIIPVSDIIKVVVIDSPVYDPYRH